MKGKEDRLDLSIAVALIAIVFLASFSVSLGKGSGPVSITVLPEVPIEGAPIFITINLNNPFHSEETVSYALYGNSILLTQGTTLLPSDSSKKYTYVYPEVLKSGERTTFLVKARTEHGEYERALSLPAYPPQIWSSFVSFATFSTSLMSSSLGSSMGSSMGSMITSVQFYDETFIENTRLNVGLTFSIVLILLLIFLELTEPGLNKGLKIIGLRLRFSKLSVILFTVFVGMVLTKVVMIIK